MSRRGRLIVAIDGPAGAGKSTVARRVAERLGYLYVDTGAMYRAIALKVDRAYALDCVERTEQLARAATVLLRKGEDGPLRIFLDGEDVTDAIRSPRINQIVSPVAALPVVRRKMVEIQREIAKDGGVVMEGRDIQTVVFPDAEVKIFLTASIGERARRRWRELQSRGVTQSLEEVEREVRERDARDSTRADSPLAAAGDAITVTTDGLTIEQVVDRIEGLVLERAARPSV